MLKWNPTDIPNLTCGREIKSRSIWTFRRDIPDNNIFTDNCTQCINYSLFDPLLRWWHHNIGLEFEDFNKIVS